MSDTTYSDTPTINVAEFTRRITGGASKVTTTVRTIDTPPTPREAKIAAGWIEIAPNHWRLPDSFAPAAPVTPKRVKVNGWVDRAFAQIIAPRYANPSPILTSRVRGMLITTGPKDVGTEDPLVIANAHRTNVRRFIEHTLNQQDMSPIGYRFAHETTDGRIVRAECERTGIYREISYRCNPAEVDQAANALLQDGWTSYDIFCAILSKRCGGAKLATVTRTVSARGRKGEGKTPIANYDHIDAFTNSETLGRKMTKTEMMHRKRLRDKLGLGPMRHDKSKVGAVATITGNPIGKQGTRDTGRFVPGQGR